MQTLQLSKITKRGSPVCRFYCVADTVDLAQLYVAATWHAERRSVNIYQRVYQQVLYSTLDIYSRRDVTLTTDRTGRNRISGDHSFVY